MVPVIASDHNGHSNTTYEKTSFLDVVPVGALGAELA
jgi:hypothetical protein